MTTSQDDELSDEQIAHMIAEQFQGLLLLELNTKIVDRERLKRLLKHPNALKSDLHQAAHLLGTHLPGELRSKRMMRPMR